MQNPPVVQGFNISSPSHANAYTTNYSTQEYGSDYNGHTGQLQPKKFNDVFFAVLFYAHLIGMGFLLLLSIQGYNGDAGGGVEFASGMVYFCSVCGIFATGLSTVTLGFMIQFASSLVKLSLFFQIGCSLALAFLGLASGAVIMAILSFVSFLFGLCYVYFVWHRIPFAAANLSTALAAVKVNLGVTVVAYFFLFLGIGWAIWWSIVAGDFMANYGGGVAFLFFLSYYWTQQVLKNTVHVTTAGVIGTWWFAPEEASSCCSKAIGVSIYITLQSKLIHVCMSIVSLTLSSIFFFIRIPSPVPLHIHLVQFAVEVSLLPSSKRCEL